MIAGCARVASVNSLCTGRPLPSTMSCPKVHACPLFPLFALKAPLRVWQEHYCERSWERCERYRAGERGEVPPANLLPNGTRLAVENGAASP